MASTLHVVQTVEKRTTSTGTPYLVLKLDDQLVSFFDEKDQHAPVQPGHQIECNIELKGKYKNGHDLRVVNAAPANLPPPTTNRPAPPSPPSSPNPSPSPAMPTPSQKVRIPVDANGRTPLHKLTAAQLEQLYMHLCDTAEPAYVGQISNQIRYARLEELLTKLLERQPTS